AFARPESPAIGVQPIAEERPAVNANESACEVLENGRPGVGADFAFHLRDDVLECPDIDPTRSAIEKNPPVTEAQRMIRFELPPQPVQGRIEQSAAGVALGVRPKGVDEL